MSATAQKQLPATNLDLSESDFQQISDIIDQACGIVLSEGKKGLVKSRLQKRIRELGLQTYADYIALVRSEHGADEMSELVSAISTNVTSFNREEHHFSHFEAAVIPKLVKMISNGETIRIWSAGCSNGSEPFTVACRLAEAISTVNRKNCKILATDIDKYSLATGNSGLYSADMVTKMPSETIGRWFTEQDGNFQISRKLQELVSFKYLNLIQPWPITKQYDAIFCRNVMIYFSEAIQESLFQKFSKHLKPGAFLYIGHSERVVGPAAHHFKPVGATTYRFEPGGNL